MLWMIIDNYLNWFIVILIKGMCRVEVIKNAELVAMVFLYFEWTISHYIWSLGYT